MSADIAMMWALERVFSRGLAKPGEGSRRVEYRDLLATNPEVVRASLGAWHLRGGCGELPHKLRHTAAHRWLAKGGSESGLMAMTGWTRTDILVRYTRAAAGERAAAEARRLDLGEPVAALWASDLTD